MDTVGGIKQNAPWENQDLQKKEEITHVVGPPAIGGVRKEKGGC